MARAGKGTALFASLEEHNLEKKVMQQLQDALQPAFTGNTQTRFDNMAINDFNRLLKRYQHKLGRLRGTFYYSNFSKTEMNLMGYGKPLEEPVAAVPSEKPEMKWRQAPCVKLVGPKFFVPLRPCLSSKILIFLYRFLLFLTADIYSVRPFSGRCPPAKMG